MLLTAPGRGSLPCLHKQTLSLALRSPKLLRRKAIEPGMYASGNFSLASHSKKKAMICKTVRGHVSLISL
jgi:hypothetical protein